MIDRAPVLHWNLHSRDLRSFSEIALPYTALLDYRDLASFELRLLAEDLILSVMHPSMMHDKG